jgi:hypothetical protein
VRAYVAFRLRAAGYHGPDLFNSAGVRYLTRATAGLTRRINIVADKALLAAFAENTHNVVLKHLRAAVQDSEFSNAGKYRGGPRWLVPAIGLTVLAAIGIGVVYYHYGAAINASGPLLPPRLNTAPEPDPISPSPTVKPASLAVESPPPEPRARDTNNHAVTPAPQTVAAKPSAPEPPEPLKMSATLSAPGDLLEQRLLATERWLEEAEGGIFSIQLLGSNDPMLLRNYFERLAKYIEIERVFVYRTVANQQPSMTVLYGAFGSRLDAVKSLEALPEELKVNRPYIRTVQGIRVETGMKKPS